MYKRIAILAVIAIISTVFWTSVSLWVNDFSWSLRPLGAWILPAVLLVVLASVISIAFVVIKERLYQILIPIIVGLLFLAVFGIRSLYPITVAILITVHLIAISRIRQEVHNQISFKVHKVVRRGMTMIILPILVMTSFAYYLTPTVQETGQGKSVPPSIVNAIESTTQKVISLNFFEIPASLRDAAEGEIMQQVKNQIYTFFSPYMRFFPPLLAFGLFIMLQGLSIVFILLATLLASGLFLVLRLVGFVRFGGKDVKEQVLEI